MSAEIIWFLLAAGLALLVLFALAAIGAAARRSGQLSGVEELAAQARKLSDDITRVDARERKP